MSDDTRIQQDLAGAIGASRIVTDPAAIARASRDTWVVSVWRGMQLAGVAKPAAVVRPESTAEVAAVLRYASDERIPIVPFGAGSGVCGAVLAPAGAIVLDLGAMNRILRIDDAALLVTVQPGMRGHEFEAALNEAGYSMGHFPQSIALSSVGGWVATRAAGQYSSKYGNIEDMLVAFEAVLADGTVVRTRPVPRAAAGPDLRHLFLGAEGTTGVLTELTFQVHPTAEATAQEAIAFPSFGAGLETLRRTMRAGWSPAVLRLYDEIEAGRQFADSVKDKESLLLVLTEGPHALVDAELAATVAIARAAGGRPVGPEPVAGWLHHRNAVPGFEVFLEKGMVVDTIEVATTWNQIDALYSGVVESVRALPGVIVCSGHSSHSYPSGTNIYFTFAAKPERPEDLEGLYFRIWDAAMEGTLAAGGTVSHHHGIGRVRRAWLARDLGSAYPLLGRLKRALDPLGIMNPGALLPEGGGDS